MNTQPDINKVREAVQRYCRNIPNRSERKLKDPVDAAIRKPLIRKADKCSGFYCRDFLHGY